MGLDDYLFSVCLKCLCVSNIEQTTRGWCSPAIADNKGKITFECYGEYQRHLKNVAQHEL